MSKLLSPLPHQINLVTLTQYINECHFQLFGFYPTDIQESNYQILHYYLIKYAEYYAKLVLEKASEEVVVDYNILGVDYILAAYHNNLPKHIMESDIEVFAIKSSITDIKLPSHD